MSVKIDGTRIRALRLDRSWSQELLAEQAGVSLRTIQRMETEGVASLQSRRAIAAAFGVSASAFTPAGAAGESAGAATAPTPGPSDIAPARAAIRLSLRTKALTITSWALLMAALIGGAFFWPHRDDNERPGGWTERKRRQHA
jgi:transcriptional regulator with XRE-family HTH domain